MLDHSLRCNGLTRRWLLHFTNAVSFDFGSRDPPLKITGEFSLLSPKGDCGAPFTPWRASTSLSLLADGM